MKDQWIYQLLLIAMAIGPLALLAVGLILRTAAIGMDDSSHHPRTQNVLKSLSFVLLVIACLTMVLASLSMGKFGIVGLLLPVFLVIAIVQSELQIAGVKNRTRQLELLWTLALALKSGRPLAEEIDAYAAGTTGKRRKQLTLFADRLGEGMPLTEIVVPQNLLPDGALMQIHSGIFSDSLEQSIVSSATRLTRELAEERESEFSGNGLAYPPALMGVATLVIAFVIYYVVPKFKQIFDDFGTELPESTTTLIRAADFVVNYWYAVGIPILMALPVAAIALAGYAEFHGLYLGWQKLFGRWFIRCHTPKLMRALSQAISKNVPIPEALSHLAHHSHIQNLRVKLGKVMLLIEEGENSWKSFQQAGFLKPRETAILLAAERASNLPWALDMLASAIEQRQVFRIRSATEVLQPLMLIPIGLLIAVICISFYMPLVKLLHDLS